MRNKNIMPGWPAAACNKNVIPGWQAAACKRGVIAETDINRRPAILYQFLLRYRVALTLARHDTYIIDRHCGQRSVIRNLMKNG